MESLRAFRAPNLGALFYIAYSVYNEAELGLPDTLIATTYFAGKKITTYKIVIFCRQIYAAIFGKAGRITGFQC